MKSIAGIDIGSGYTKCMICDNGGTTLGSSVLKTDPDFNASALRAMKAAQTKKNGAPCDYIISTGVGRYNVVSRNIQITDVTASAKGVSNLFPGVEYILDVGSQVTRAIKINHRGQVTDFKCNEKCAAGSGSFIEKAVKYLEIDLKDAGKLALRASEPQPISSICAILAESEIINHVSEGKTVDNILMGVYESLADRALLLLKRIGFNGAKCAFIGGLAVQAGMVQACKKKFNCEICIPDDPQLTTVHGSVLMAIQRLQKLGNAVKT